MAIFACPLAAEDWPDLPLVKTGSQYGKTMLTPPAGCVFIRRTQVGPVPTHGTACAVGLLGADKYGQDKGACEARAPAISSGAHVLCADAELVPRVLDAEVLFLRPLGAGAFGEVRLARLPGGDLAAVKLAAAGKEATLTVEAATHARLAHANIVQLRAVVVARATGAVRGLAMDVCRGGSLSAWLDWSRAHAAAPLPLARRLDILAQLLAALDHMHRRGVCHLDVKPCNVMLSAADLVRPQLVRLADFGLSQARGGAPMAGRYRGTLPYMAPEFARQPRSVAAPAMDMWSVGVLMRALVTSRPPCAALSPAGIKSGLRAGSLYAAPPPCEPAWAHLMQRCLAYDAARRPSAAEARAAVLALLPCATAAPPPPPPPPPAHAFAAPPATVPQGAEAAQLGSVAGKAGSCCASRAVMVAAPRSLHLPESLGLTSF